MHKNIVVLVSGRGSNAKNIDQYFREKYGYGISTLISSKHNPDLQNWAQSRSIDYIEINKNLKHDGNAIWEVPQVENADIIVLAGFLKKIPTEMISATHAPIINIHPSLLPKYGGKGMYGARVHEAVLSSDDKRSGITIHYVNEKYDEGTIIRQVSIDLDPKETLDSLQEKIHQLEYQNFPEVVEEMLYS